MELKICHMYPDIMNLYGDRGNVISMEKRLKWRGIDCQTVRMPLGCTDSLNGFDVVFIGGGQDIPQQLVDELRRGRAAEMKAAVEDGVSFLTVAAGYQLMGQYRSDTDGKRIELAGIVDMYTELRPERLTGNFKFKCCDELGGGIVVGFENHNGRSYIGSGARPLGTVLAGFGNNGEDNSEGLIYKNLIGTYSHGPVLPKNPQLCDRILLTALRRKYGTAELIPLDDKAELCAHAEMSSKL